MHCTHYVDASGLDPRDRSCPADLAALAIRAMAQPRIRRIARKSGARVWPGAGNKITLRTTNHLLREHYPGAIGLKTGYTLVAGHCLVAIIQRGATRIGIVLLGSKTDAFADARRIARAAAQAGIIAPAATPRDRARGVAGSVAPQPAFPARPEGRSRMLRGRSENGARLCG